MFVFFGRAKRAETIAASIAQLIHMISGGKEHIGPSSPERLLRRLGTNIKEETMGGGVRALRALVPMTTKQAFWVKLLMPPDNRPQVLTVEGNESYAGFTLSCGVPPKAITIDLQPGFSRSVTKDARALYAACKTMPGPLK
jgi:hypothetical protein